LFFEDPCRRWFLDVAGLESDRKDHWFAVMASFILNLNRKSEGVEIQEFIPPRDQRVQIDVTI
jgi:hypothetical protein